MTAKIELTNEETSRLTARTAQAGLTPADYLHSLLDLEPTGTLPHEDMVAYLRAAGVLGAVRGILRSDGRAWRHNFGCCAMNGKDG